MADFNGETDIDVETIARNATRSAQAASPSNDLSWRMRIGLFLAILIVSVNAVVGVFNSLVLRAEVKCNHQLTNALNIVGDQNRNITKNAIDQALSGKPLTETQVDNIRQTYDTKFNENTTKRNALLETTCQDGAGSPSSSGS